MGFPASATRQEALPMRRVPFTERPFQKDPAIQTSVSRELAATAGLSFEGLGKANMSITGTPPDTDGAVGATQYVQWVNTSFAVFNKKTGAKIGGPFAGNSLWRGFGTACERDNDGDPVVLWDKAAQRWVFTQFAVTGGPPYLQCFAVSTSTDATGSYFRYAWQFPNFNDYGKMSIWRDAYYIAFNMFSPSGPFVGAKVCAANRAKMLVGAAAQLQCFQEIHSEAGFLPSDIDGTTLPPAGAPAYFVDMSTNALHLFKFHVDFSNINNTRLTGPVNIPVAAFNRACGGTGGDCIPQPGTTQKLESAGDRLMFRLAYRNFGNHESLVVNHSVDLGGGRTAFRWYEIRTPGGTPTVFQQGTFSPDTKSRWMGSIAMDKAGNFGAGFSVSSTALHPSIYVTGRTPADPLGTLETESGVVIGGGSQIGIPRWGDYSAMTVDPSDDCTFWYTQEYLQSNGSFNWSTHIKSFKFATCGTPKVSLSPTSVAFGNQAVGTPSSAHVVTLTNVGNATLTLSKISFTGTNPGDFAKTTTCGGTLAPSAKCTVSVTFKPTAKGARSAALTFTDNATPSSQSVSLSGTGT
jgi:hypothetical protein